MQNPWKTITSYDECSEDDKYTSIKRTSSLTKQRGNDVDGMDESDKNIIPLAVFSADRTIPSPGAKPAEQTILSKPVDQTIPSPGAKPEEQTILSKPVDQTIPSPGAKPEESFRLVNEELSSMFSAPNPTFTRRLAKKNPSAPAGSLAFSAAKKIAEDFSIPPDGADGEELDLSATSSNVSAVRSHPTLKASRSMYIVGPSLHQEVNDTFSKMNYFSKGVEIERTSTIDEEDSPSSSNDDDDDEDDNDDDGDDDEPPIIESSENVLRSGEDDISRGSEEVTQPETSQYTEVNVTDNVSQVSAELERVLTNPNSPVATPSSVHIHISPIESPTPSYNERQELTSSFNTSLGTNILYPGLHKTSSGSLNTQPASRAQSPVFFRRPPSPPARSVTPVSPVASIPRLASINELEKSTSQDEDGKSGGSFCGTFWRQDYRDRAFDEAKRSPLNLDTSVEVHQYKNSLLTVTAFPERRHSAGEAFGPVQDAAEATGFVESLVADTVNGDGEINLDCGITSSSKAHDTLASSKDYAKNNPSTSKTERSKSQRRKRLVKRRSDLKSSEKSQDSYSSNNSENDNNLDALSKDRVDGSTCKYRKSIENVEDIEEDDPHGLRRFVAELSSRIRKQNWTPSLSSRLLEYRHKILTQKSVKASGIVLLKETRRKKVKQLSNFFNNLAYTLAPWGKSIRDIEGHHGAGVASYFLFLRWMFGFNIALFALMTAFIVVPMIVIGDTPLAASTDSIVNTSYYCSLNYTVVEQQGISYLIEFIQGTGWMEKTLAFHGYYVTNLSGTYNLPLAYVLTVLACMLVSLALMARYTSKSFEAALLNSMDTNFEYSNKVFGAWDYGLIDEEAARLKQKGIHYDLQSEMMEQTFMRTRMERLENKCAMFKLYFVRTVINLLIIFLLGAAAYAIVKVTSWSTSYASSHSDASGMDEWVLLLVQYLPSLTITACNALLPLIFELVVELEDYSQAFVIKITLIRTVFLRLASIVVLLITLFTEITCGPTNDCRTTVEPGCSDIRCWESYVGQQLYKLVILDFVVAVVKVFAVELPRKFLAEKCQCGLIQKIGPPEFNITSNVLDLIYAQCLIWLGLLLCPLLPGMMVVKSFIMFFVKKFSAMVACPPSEKPYRASRINTFFMIILLLTYFLCAVPVLYAIFGIHPSRGCGPFRLVDYMNEAIENAVEEWPLFLANTYDLFTSAAFSGTVIILLGMIIYYLNTMSKAHNQRANLLKEQLIMEGRDKQFLLTKLQEQDKKRQPKKTEPPPKPNKKAGSPPQQPRGKKRAQDSDRHNPRSNDPDEGSFSPPHYVEENPEW